MTRASGLAGAEQINPLSVKNVEVYRGANALEYGVATLELPQHRCSHVKIILLPDGLKNIRRGIFKTGISLLIFDN